MGVGEEGRGGWVGVGLLPSDISPLLLEVMDPNSHGLITKLMTGESVLMVKEITHQVGRQYQPTFVDVFQPWVVEDG